MLVINHNLVEIRKNFYSNKAQTAKTILTLSERERKRLINIKAESSKNILHK
jgi:hypothetical protein